MKTAVTAIFALSLGALSLFAANGDADHPPQGDADRLPQQDTPAKRVASVKWNIETGKLEWVVQSGVERNGQFVPSSKEEHYEISPEDAKMVVQGQQRAFTSQEADWLQSLLHVLTVYCAESTIWWEQGKGTPLDEQGKPLNNGQPSSPPADHSNGLDTTPHKVLLNPAPQRKVPGAVRLVAETMIQ
jgi:hypothetical protein